MSLLKRKQVHQEDGILCGQEHIQSKPNDMENVHGMLSGESRLQHNKQYDANCMCMHLSLGLSHVTQAGLKSNCVAEEGLVLTDPRLPIYQGLG